MAPTALRATRHARRLLPTLAFIITAGCSDDGPVAPDSATDGPLAAAAGLDVVSVVALEGFLEADVNVSEARDVNDLGMAVGYSSYGVGLRAALWDDSRFAIELPGLGGTSIAGGVSADGTVIVGGAGAPQADGSNKYYAVRWLKPGASWVVDPLSYPFGATSCGASKVSDDGTTVGGVCDFEDGDHAVVWQNGAVRDLGRGYLYDVTGTAAAGVIHTPQQTPVVWDLTAGAAPDPTPIGSLGGLSGSAKGIDAEGTVVGFSEDPTRELTPFVYTPRKGMVALPLLPNTNFASGNSVSGDRIVGWSHFGSSSTHATLWQKGKVVNLGALPGYESATAWSVSPGGTVVGFSSNSYGPYRATMWKLK